MANLNYSKNDLLNMSVDDLLKLKNEITRKKSKNKLKTSSYNCSSKESSNHSDESLACPIKERISYHATTSSNKTGKNASPVEMPLTRKKPPPLWKNPTNVIKSKTRFTRDPRFDDLSGKLDMVAWSKNYKFLEDMKNKERSVLMKELRATEDPETRQRIKLSLQALNNRTREKKKIDQQRYVKKAERESTIEALKQGRRPFIKNKSQVKLEMLAKQYQTLKKERRLDKYLERKEKKKRAQELFK